MPRPARGQVIERKTKRGRTGFTGARVSPLQRFVSLSRPVAASTAAQT